MRQTWLEKSPLDRLKPVKVGQVGRRRLRRNLTVDELERLCAACRRDRTAVCYRVAAYSGFRKKELRKLRKEDCTPTGDRPRWHTGPHVTKNKQPVRLPMFPECAEALREHWLRLPDGATLLAVPRKETFWDQLKKAGIPRVDERGRHVDFHSLRYTFCWLAAQKQLVAYGGRYHGKLAQAVGDMPALLAEIERAQDQLAEAWLVLDEVARLSKDPSSASSAQRLLRRQQAPGWKDRPQT